MSEFVIGTQNVAFTVGMAHCETRGISLPFFAFAPSDKVTADLQEDRAALTYEDEARVRATYETFAKHGTVIWIDHLDAAERMLGMMSVLLDRCCETTWVRRTEQVEVPQ